MMHPESLETIQRALTEDIGTGDVTTEACVPADRMASGYFMARGPLVLAGVEVLMPIYAARGGVDGLTILREDGDQLQDGDRIAEVRGPARTLLECERLALNFLQRLSGVATLANRFARLVEGTKCKVLDT